MKRTIYYVDSEFIDDGKTVDLISIGIVCEDGRELYLQSSEFNIDKASQWVKDNVIMHLDLCPYIQQPPGPLYSLGTLYGAQAQHRKGQCVDQIYGLRHRCPWRTRAQMRRDLLGFFGFSSGTPEGIELRGWITAYDYVAFAQVFGTMLDVPAGLPHYIHELQAILDAQGITDDMLPPQEAGLHRAIDDARHIKRLWELVKAR
jgi:hypothetical protein